MPIDSSIALGVKPIEIESPVNQLARVMQIQGLQGQNRLHELQMMQAQQGLEDTNKLNQLYQSAIGQDGKIDRTALIRGAAQQNLGKHIPTLQKGFTDADKAQADLSKSQIEATTKKLDLAGQAFGYVRSNPTLENANAVLDYLGQNGVYTPQEVATHKAAVAANPGKVAQLADMAFRTVLDAKDQLAKYETRNTGGTTDTIAIDPVTGKVAQINSVKNTQSPDSVATTSIARERLNMEKANQVAESGGPSQAAFTKQFGKPAPGYRWKADGSQEFIPGGPADQKAQQKTVGEGTVDSVVADLRDKYEKLQKGGGITDPSNSMLGNVGAYVGSTGVGQTVGKALGTQNQSSRDAIAMTRPLLLQAIMKATGMSAKQMDSNAELKLWLATATDPTLSLQANREALDRIEQLYGSGSRGGSKPGSPNIDALLDKYK